MSKNHKMRSVVLKKIAISVALFAISSTLAIAADPIPVDEQVVIDEARFDWSGLYVGGSIGKAKSDVHISFPTATFLWSDPNGNGATYSIYAGYNLNLQNELIFGIEGDLTKSTVGGTAPVYGYSSPIEKWDVDINWMASIRARLGVAVNKQLLIFATGGWAWG